MTEKTYAGACIYCSNEGYLTDLDQWTREVGNEIATEEGIQMTDNHWQVIEYLQDQCRQEIPLTIRKVGKSGVVSIKEFYALFPGGPLKKASRIAGIPKPVSCI
ncbi:MAG: TusE/DsrC/DsvC family sulfur relay protein [Saprospiraceae bacterium]|jgi:TusE/DsrC/DsvC family sulfur relay protein